MNRKGHEKIMHIIVISDICDIIIVVLLLLLLLWLLVYLMRQ